MKVKHAVPILLIVPVILFVTAHILAHAEMPYYLLGRADNSYVFLMNALNLAQASGFGIGYYDHPGIPVMEIGTVVVKIFHYFSGNDLGIVQDVLHRPESYLEAILFTLILLNAAGLFFLGFAEYKIHRNIFAALFLQMTPFFSLTVFYRLSVVTSENLLIFITTLLIIISLKYIYSSDLDFKKNLYYLAGFGFISALGIATKITFFPLLLIPLILIKKFSNKLLYILSTIISFFIVAFPALPLYKLFWRWLKTLITHEGIHGGGARGIFNWPIYIMNLRLIFQTDTFFTITFIVIFLAIVFTIIIFFVNRKNKNFISFEKIKDEFKFLSAIFIVMSVQIFMVAKHFSMHYMVPALTLSVTGIFLIICIMYKMYGELFKKVRWSYSFIFLILMVIIIKMPAYITFYTNNKLERDEAYKADQFIQKNYNDKVVLSGNGSWNKKMALEFAMPWSGAKKSVYKVEIDRMTPAHLYYDNFSGRIYAISDSSKAGEILAANKEIIFQSNTEFNSIDSVMSKLKNDFNYQNSHYKEVFSNEKTRDVVYEIYLSR